MPQPRLEGMGSALAIPEPDETPAIRRGPGLHPAVREFVIPLPPMPWKRAGFNKRTGQHYTAADRRRRMDEIGLLWRGSRQQALDEADIGGHFEFVFEHAASHFNAAGHLLPEWVGSRPGQNLGDLDNLVKLVKDALNRVAYADDAQVAELSAAKRWAEGGERAHTRVALWPL